MLGCIHGIGLIPHLAPLAPLVPRAPLLYALHLPFRSPSTTHATPSASLHCAQTWALCAQHTCTTATSRCAPSLGLVHAADELLRVRRDRTVSDCPSSRSTCYGVTDVCCRAECGETSAVGGWTLAPVLSISSNFGNVATADLGASLGLGYPTYPRARSVIAVDPVIASTITYTRLSSATLYHTLLLYIH